MKTKITFLFFGLLLLAGCSADNDAINSVSQQQTNEADKRAMNNIKNLPIQNKVLLLKVDFLSQNFEGGKELVFETTSGFTIASEYQSPGDFGGITLRYAETDDLLFSGTIHWMGLGQMNYPESLNPANSFQTLVNPLPMPNTSLFATVDYTENAYYPDPVPFESLWESIDNLLVVAQFRASNPASTINVFLYTPSVGIGNPEDWDYFVILKN